MSKKIWTHPKIKGEWVGSTLAASVKGYYERCFILILFSVDSKGKKVKPVLKARSFESWQHAIKEGWSRK